MHGLYDLVQSRGNWKSLVEPAFGKAKRAQNFKGLDDVLTLMFLCYLSPDPKLRSEGTERRTNRHLLLEGAAGTGKSEITKSFASVLELAELDGNKVGTKNARKQYQRVQGTNQLMPSDFIGREVRDKAGKFEFLLGPLLHFEEGDNYAPRILFVDELNRIPERTLSVLIEAMAEGTVTINSGVPRVLTKRGGETEERDEAATLEHFFVIATQNPSFHVGTSAVPEAVLDRFMASVVMPFPSLEQVKDILLNEERAVPDQQADSRVDSKKVREETAKAVVEENLIEFIARLIRHTMPLTQFRSVSTDWQKELLPDQQLRHHVDRNIDRGVGIRASQSLVALCKALAWCASEGDVIIATRDHVVQVAPYVLTHRLGFKAGNSVSMNDRERWARTYVELMSQLFG